MNTLQSVNECISEELNNIVEQCIQRCVQECKTDSAHMIRAVVPKTIEVFISPTDYTVTLYSQNHTEIKDEYPKLLELIGVSNRMIRERYPTTIYDEEMLVFYRLLQDEKAESYLEVGVLTRDSAAIAKRMSRHALETYLAAGSQAAVCME
jgi:hypothetical protein